MLRDLAITFAGGGNRAFYQYGLMLRWWDRLQPRVAAFSTCSAGACVAVMLLTGRRELAREEFLARTAGITKNFDLGRLLRGRRPAPHGEVYRAILMRMLEEGGLERLRAQPFPFLVLASAFPRWWPSPLAAAIGISAYQLEKSFDKRVLHPTFGRRVGFAPAVFDARHCESPAELADLVIASSSTPPFTPVGRYRGRVLLDGGMIDNAPAFVGDGVEGVRRNVVLMTRPYPADLVGIRGARLYVTPTRPVPVGRWDYTRPLAVEEAVEMGERDADIHDAMLTEFLEG
jgi:predicted acylesterase/phospholipase RssA